MVDQFSQYLTLCPTRETTAKTAAELIMDHIIIKFGCVRYRISYRSSSWLNELFKKFLTMERMSNAHFKTSPFRPSTKARTENPKRHLVRVPSAHCADITEFHLLLPTKSAAVNEQSTLLWAYPRSTFCKGKITCFTWTRR
jgi:hypothetical protein